MNPDQQRLIEATLALAADADSQIALFPAFVAPADELALNFDDAFQRCRQLADDGDQLTMAMAASFAGIDSMLAAMTRRRDTTLWTAEALATRPEWHELRALARAALDRLGVEPARPTLHGITYVRG